MLELAPILVAVLAFGAVAACVFVFGQYAWTQARLQKRLLVPAQQSSAVAGAPSPSTFDTFVSKYFDETRFGVDETLRGKLRRELIKAGFFRRNALNYYIFNRIALVIIVPTVIYLIVEATVSDLPWLLKMAILMISAFIAILGPDAYIARRQRVLTTRYRQVFPDFLDLLVVCVDAGLSLEAALARVSTEVIKQSREFGMNLMIMEAEMRAGRNTIEALELLADRLLVDEARSLTLVLRQSIELGSDTADTLRVFSDEMREKRSLRAEEAANKLPVKMVGPMALFIFPVILLLIMLPLGLRVAAVLGNTPGLK
jgi:tight adherence protein C